MTASSKYLSWLICCGVALFFFCELQGQNNQTYQEVQLINNNIVFITSAGIIKIFNSESKQLKVELNIQKNKSNSFYINADKNEMLVSFEDSTLKTFYFDISEPLKLKEKKSIRLQDRVYGFLKNSKNSLYGIASGGIFNISNDKFFCFDTTLNAAIGMRSRTSFPKVYCWEMDVDDNIWLDMDLENGAGD